MIWTVLDEEKRGIRRKEGRGERRDEEEGGTRRKEERGECKNEKVVKKWKTKKSLKDASLASLGLVKPAAGETFCKITFEDSSNIFRLIRAFFKD